MDRGDGRELVDCRSRQAVGRPTLGAVRRAAEFLLLAALVGAMVASVPLLASNNLLPRRLAFHLAALAALGLALWRPTPVRRGLPLLGLAAWSLVCWAISPVRAASLPGLLDVEAATALALAVAMARVQRRRLLLAFVGVACVGAVVGLAGQWVDLPLGEATRPAGLFASRSTAGALMAACIPLTLAALRRRPSLAVACAALEVAFLVSTRARAAWAAAAVAVVVVTLSVPVLRRVAVLAVGAGVALALLLTPGPTLRWASTAPYGDSLASLATLRLGDRWELWVETSRLVAVRPWGWGPGSYEAAFAPHAPTRFVEAQVRVEAPHNEFLRYAFELGGPGVVLLALAAWRRRARPSAGTWPLLASLGALAMCAMSGKTLLEPPTLALTCCLGGVLLRQRAGPRRPVPRGALVGAAVALASLAGWVDVQEVRTSRALAQAKEASARGLPREAWEGISPRLGQSADVGVWLDVMELLQSAGDSKRCLDVAGEALTVFPAHPLLLRSQRACSFDGAPSGG